MSAKQYVYANGKRKTSSVQIRLYSDGKGKIEVNGKDVTEYFSTPEMIGCILSPFETVAQKNQYDVTAVTRGGGLQSQAEACRHGIARALVSHDPSLRYALKHAGLLTRDARIKERKKPGLKRARKSSQWSKR